MRTTLMAAATIALLGVPAPGHARQATDAPQPITGTLRVNVSEVMTMARLQQLLQSCGYSDIRLPPVKPNLANPRPDMQPYGVGGIRTSNPQLTPVHRGWNGTAIHAGHRVNIVVG